MAVNCCAIAPQGQRDVAGWQNAAPKSGTETAIGLRCRKHLLSTLRFSVSEA